MPFGKNNMSKFNLDSFKTLLELYIRRIDFFEDDDDDFDLDYLSIMDIGDDFSDEDEDEDDDFYKFTCFPIYLRDILVIGTIKKWYFSEEDFENQQISKLINCCEDFSIIYRKDGTSFVTVIKFIRKTKNLIINHDLVR
ncbi:MAG: hypothetical protein Satyrvirus7_1 [Satyrvirus sp.]|uniref:Uncharacterized protein n=1 Tax=Satyrvirus sp. TaxID=2487771 RepID=A0A3G5ADG7_9VIRU|nr:MAG: hypothetical protein Satyrvirus7_1 [Satyrvirus sp.]